jgi:hypothetical protein
VKPRILGASLQFAVDGGQKETVCAQQRVTGRRRREVLQDSGDSPVSQNSGPSPHSRSEGLGAVHSLNGGRAAALLGASGQIPNEGQVRADRSVRLQGVGARGTQCTAS